MLLPVVQASQFVAGEALFSFASDARGYTASAAPREDWTNAFADLLHSPYIDVAGADMLTTLNKDLTARGARLRIVEAHAKVRDLLPGGRTGR